MPPNIGYCRLCEKQLSDDSLVCPHCGLENPVDRYEDLALGQVYGAEYLGMAVGDLHWFKLKHSGRRVFAKIPSEDEAQAVFGELCKRNGEHWLECHSFEGRFPNFRYCPGASSG